MSETQQRLAQRFLRSDYRKIRAIAIRQAGVPLFPASFNGVRRIPIHSDDDIYAYPFPELFAPTDHFLVILPA